MSTRELSVSPEVAAELFKKDAEIVSARRVANAVIAAAKSSVDAAAAEYNATLRTILLHAGIEQGTVRESKGLGADTVLVIELPDPPAVSEPTT